ncbi:anti-sigma factor domain-containing protein [Brachybacterium paraconglomeratum]|uniref:anti-sigma factor domain-containing protein n=1 Tax=Brachybacterium paraconglomeratum TaxID=173362 RepID=UPI0022E67CB7|nr:anti-sigma factor [Brachybacterium paraconglomeratum]
MNEQKHTMTGAWALNALDADERERMRRYLDEDPEAAAEARAFEETAGELAASLPPLAPPPQLRSAVMARIATTRQLSPLPEDEQVEQDPPQAIDAADVAGPTTSTEPAPTSAPSEPSTPPAPGAPTAEGSATSTDAPEPVVSLDRYRASVRRSRWTAVAAAALLLTTIVGIGLWNGERAAQEEVQATLTAMESQQAAAQQEREMLSALLSADDASRLSVPVGDGGSLELMYSRDQQAMIVQPDGLEVLPADRTYQVWMIEGDEITSAGLLEDPSAAMMHPGAIPEGVVVGLTVEPAGGSDQPTMAPMAKGELT